MSRLDELIDHYCPYGVTYKTLGELGKFYGGLTGKSKDDFQDGNAIFITYKNVYSNPSLDINSEDKVKIGVDEKQRTLEYGDVIFTGSSETPDECGISSVVCEEPTEPLYLNSFCFIFRFNDLSIMESGFAKHLFRSGDLRYQIGKTASGVTRFNVSKKLMEKVSIPVPPLEVQREIVHILDSFTLLTAELTAELTARQKQYIFYRKTLLSLEDDENCRHLSLKELFNTRNGYTPSKSNDEFWSKKDVPWFRMEDIRENGRVLDGAIQYVSNSAVKGKPFPANSIIVSTSATIGEHALIRVPFLSNQRFTCLMLKEEFVDSVNMEYIFYYCYKLGDYCRNHLNQGNFASVDMTSFNSFVFDLPDISIQNKIVETLKKFDFLCSSISDGLPAEIDARKKQYSYYRDKLLTFKASEK